MGVGGCQYFLFEVSMVGLEKLFYNPEDLMRLVIVESPYAGDIEQNIQYGRACMRDCLLRGEAPFASHLLYTQEGVLDDAIPEERDYGINAGFSWRSVAEATVVYIDHGISRGMQKGIDHARAEGKPVEYRQLIKDIKRLSDKE